ncbi:MAG: hypothetical protein IT449_10830 [Phycisphaerales bacterium]|nr:hypothetical protein [Phycisphaerales bacterium]
MINNRAGGMGLTSGRKTFQKLMAEGVDLPNAIQDVYLDKGIVLAQGNQVRLRLALMT